MGAGGAGKALAHGGKQKGARVVVANRTYGEKLQSCPSTPIAKFLGLNPLPNTSLKCWERKR